MEGKSFERSSIISERCAKCGGNLPCSLHDREMKRVMMEDKDPRPDFEKTWEMEGVADVLQGNKDGRRYCVKRIPDSYDSKRGTEFQLILLNQGENGKWESEVSPRRLWFVNDHNEKQVCEYGAYEFYTTVDNRLVLQIQELDTGKTVTCEFGILRSDQEIGMASTHVYQVVRFRDGFMVTGWFDKGLDFKKIIEPSKSAKDEWSCQDFSCENEEAEHILFIPKTAHQINDTEHLLVFVPFKLYLMTRGKDGRQRLERLRDRRGNKILAPGSAPWSVFTLDQHTKRLLIRASGCLSLIEPDQEISGAWKIKNIAIAKGMQEIENDPYHRVRPLECLITALSPRSFIVGCRGERDVWLYEEDEAGEWKSRAVVLNEPQKIERLEAVSGDHPGFFICGDGRLTYWTIPLDKLRAYHKRKTEQNKPPPMPADL